ncbi:C-type mannose receptor 2-like [Sardina pilchardus]|uniref:C-type mannose receptor 2-like n=1 Tax=Sardina pilchardus TaxID=27697 RepID=UPI002E10EE5B
MMDRKAIHVLFLYGFYIGLVHASHQYYYVADPKTWTEAQTYCREKYIDLATISNDTEKKRFLDWAQNIKGSAWIGLYRDLPGWRWSAGSSDYRDWTTDGVSTSMVPEEYVAIVYKQWENHAYTHAHNFICYDERLNACHGFVLISQDKKWRDAQSYCREKHTDLATVKDAIENEKIKEIAASYTWIGLHRLGWQWSDGSNFSPTFSFSKTPTASGSKRLCVVLIRSSPAENIEWEALNCTVKKPFVCYGEVKKKTVQIHRIRFHSDVNVNNAAAQEAILDQIKKKLQEKGLPADAKLSWRKQSDGQIFHEKKDKKRENKKKKRNSRDEF